MAPLVARLAVAAAATHALDAMAGAEAASAGAAAFSDWAASPAAADSDGDDFGSLRMLFGTETDGNETLDDEDDATSTPTTSTRPADRDGETCAGYSAQRRRASGRCSCRRRSSTVWKNVREDADTKVVCGGRSTRSDRDRLVPLYDDDDSACQAPSPSPPGSPAACLCLFDIDRTLTGREGDLQRCPRNQRTDFFDDAYDKGYATLSEMARVGISNTFCNQCYLGVVSAGHGSGEDSEWNRYIMDTLVRGEVHDAFLAEHPEAKKWSSWNVWSPYVLSVRADGDRQTVDEKFKPTAAELIRRWYGSAGRGVCIQPESVYFFGDRTDNIKAFAERSMNSREVSCGSRDSSRYTSDAVYPGTLIGYCGARHAEIQRVRGNFLCKELNYTWDDDLPSETTSAAPADTCSGSSVQRRRRHGKMCSCRRRHSTIWKNPIHELDEPLVCGGRSHVDDTDRMVPRPDDRSSTCDPSSTLSGCRGACLCLFDIDRTLTGQQGDVDRCPQNQLTDMYDDGYGKGNATLSELAKVGINKTFCNKCYLGLVSAGHGSGESSEWNRYIMDNLVRGEVHDAFVAQHPEAKKWSSWDVWSPYILLVPNVNKSWAAELVRQWYGGPGRDICIHAENVYFFGDRTENIKAFEKRGMNSREVSCNSRDETRYTSHGEYPGTLIGYCGARHDEIKRVRGNFLCEELPEAGQELVCNETDPHDGEGHRDVEPTNQPPPTSAAQRGRLAALGVWFALPLVGRA